MILFLDLIIMKFREVKELLKITQLVNQSVGMNVDLLTPSPVFSYIIISLILKLLYFVSVFLAIFKVVSGL